MVPGYGIISNYMNRIFQLTSFCGVLSLLALASITNIDIFLREFLSRSFPDVIELSGALLGLLIAFALPAAATDDTHLSVNLIVQYFNKKWQHIINIFSYIITASVFGILGWTGLIKMHSSYSTNEFIGGYEINIWPFRLVLAAVFVWSAIIFIRRTLKLLKQVLEGNT